MRLASSAGLAGVSLLLDMCGLFTLLLLSVPGGLVWPPALMALHFLFSERALWQPVQVPPPARSARPPETPRTPRTPPSPRLLRVQGRDLVWVAPRWWRVVAFSLALLQLLVTLIASLVIGLAPAAASLFTHTDTRALGHTVGVYKVATVDGEWRRFALCLCLCAGLALFTVALPMALDRAARTKGKRLVVCGSALRPTSDTPLPTVPQTTLYLLLTSVVVALVPSFDHVWLLLWHLCAVGGATVVLAHVRTTQAQRRHRTLSESALAMGADTTLHWQRRINEPSRSPRARRTRYFGAVHTVLLALFSTVFLLVQVILQVPPVVTAVNARLHETRDCATVVCGTTTGWSALWRTANWPDALGRGDAAAWRKLCQLLLLLPVAVIARRRLAWSPSLPWCAQRTPLRRSFIVTHTAEDGAEGRTTARRSRQASQCGPRPRLVRLVCRAREVFLRHFVSLITVPTLLLAALFVQDMVGIVLLATALVSLVVRAHWWLYTGLLVAGLTSALLLLAEYIVVLCSGAAITTPEAMRTMGTVQRALFLHRRDAAPVQPSDLRYVWTTVLNMLAVDVVFIARLVSVYLDTSATRTASAGVGDAREELNSAAAQALPRRLKTAIAQRQRAYMNATTLTSTTTPLETLAQDFDALLDVQASHSESSSAACLHVPALLPQVLRAANQRAIERSPVIRHKHLPLPHLLSSSRMTRLARATTWTTLWHLAACGESLTLAVLAASMRTSDSSLRMATWQQLASPIERPLTPRRDTRADLPLYAADDTAACLSTRQNEDTADGVDTPRDDERRSSVESDAHRVNRLLSVGSPGHGSLSFLDFLWLIDALHDYHVANSGAQRHAAWRAWVLLALHVASVYATPVLLLVLFAAAMTVQDLDVLNALYVLFFLLFICERTWQGVLTVRHYTVCCCWRQWLFTWYVVVHVVVVFVGHLVQTSYADLWSTQTATDKGSALHAVLVFIGVLTDRPVAQLLVYVVLLYLAHLIDAHHDDEADVIGTSSDASLASRDTLSVCLTRAEWGVFEAQPRWQPVRRALCMGTIGLILVLLTVLLHHSVLVLGLGVLYCVFLLTSGEQARPSRLRTMRLGLHKVALVSLGVYCPAVLLWTALTQLPRIRTAVRDALVDVGCDPRELGVYAQDALGRGGTVPLLLLPWYLLSPLTASLLVLTRLHAAPTPATAHDAARGEEPSTHSETSSSIASDVPSSQDSDACADPIFESSSVRLAQSLLTCALAVGRRTRRVLTVLQVAPLAQWSFCLAVAGTNVSCLGLLYGLAYAVSWPHPLGLALCALAHVLLQYLYGLTLITHTGAGLVTAEPHPQGIARYQTAVQVLDYVGLHTPLTSSAMSARYMLLPILVAVSAMSRLVLVDTVPVRTPPCLDTTAAAATRSHTEPSYASENVAFEAETPDACLEDAHTRWQRPQATASTVASCMSHEPVEYHEDNGTDGADEQENAYNAHTRWQDALVRYVRERAFGDLIYEVLMLILVLAVALLMNTVVSVALLVVVVALACVGRARLLQSRALAIGFDVVLVVILLYAYVIALGLPQIDSTRDGDAQTTASSRLPVLLQRAHHDQCDSWDRYAGCALPTQGWVLLCLLALGLRLLRRHRLHIEHFTLPEPIQGCRDLDALFTQYDKASARAAQEWVEGSVRRRARTPMRAFDSHDEEEAMQEMEPFSPPSPHRHTAPPPSPPAQPRVRARQTRILAALHAFEGCRDCVRDPHSPLEWLYTALTQLLPASVLLFVHGVLLANMAGVLMAVLVLTLLCARRRFVERWTRVWWWLSLALTLLLVPQWLWRVPAFAAQRDTFRNHGTPSSSWKVTVVEVCGVGPWSTRALLLHVLVLWSAVTVEWRLFNDFHFAPYLLGLCRTSASAHSRRERIRWLYQTRWQRRERVARAQEKQLHETLERLAAARQPAPASLPSLPSPLARASHSPKSRVHRDADSDKDSNAAAQDGEEREALVAAEAVLHSVTASRVADDAARCRPRTGSIAFVLVEPPPSTQATLFPAWHGACASAAAGAAASSSSSSLSPSPTPGHATGSPEAEVLRDLDEKEDVRLPADVPPAPQRGRICAFWHRTARSVTRHLLAHSYQPELSPRLAQHTLVALCVAVFRYAVRHSAGACFVLLLLNYALSGVLTDMLFSLSALLFSMVARPWAGRRYWHGLLAGLVVSTAMKLVCQVVVARLDESTLPYGFLQTVRIVFLDLGRTNAVSASAMRTDILLDFACCFAVLAHCHASHDLGLFDAGYKKDIAGAIADSTTATSAMTEPSGWASTTPLSASRGVRLSFRSRSSSRASATTTTTTYSGGPDEARTSTQSPSVVLLDIDQMVMEDEEEEEVRGEVACTSPVRVPQTTRLTGLVRSFRHALVDLYRQRRGRRGAGADHYTIQFWLDSVALIVLCWAFFAIRYASASWRNNNVVSSLERNLLPGLFVVLLLVAVVLLCAERVVYVCQSGLAKYILHALLVLLYHVAFMVWRVEGATWSDLSHSPLDGSAAVPLSSSPSDVSSTVASNAPPSPLAPALTLLLVKLASAWVSAWQLRAGYPLMRRHDPFTARTDLFHWLGHIIARAIPFLLEVRLFLDWVFSTTSLKVQHWWLLEDVHHTVYLRFVDMSDIHWTSRRKGKRFPPLVKLYQGVVGVLAVLVALFFPLFFYSTFSPQTQPTLVRNCRVELTLQPQAGSALGAVRLYAAEADTPRRAQQEILLYEPFARTTSLPLLEPNFLSDARVIQSVALPALSAAQWSATPETLDVVHTRLAATSRSSSSGNGTGTASTSSASAVRLRLRITYLSQTQSERDNAISDASGLVGNDVVTTLEYVLPPSAVTQLAQALREVTEPSLSSAGASSGRLCAGDNRTRTELSTSETSPLRTTVDLPRFIYPQWINSGTTLQPVTDDSAETAVRHCHVRLHGHVCAHSLSSLFYCDDASATSDTDTTRTIPTTLMSLTQPRLFLLVRSLDATTSTGILGYLSNLGILAIYTTLVLALSNLLRGVIAGGAHQVILRQMANPQPLARILRHLYWVRSSASEGQAEQALWLEQQLFLELVDLLRDPTRLIEEGGRRVDDYDEQGLFQEHLARAAERPFSG